MQSDTATWLLAIAVLLSSLALVTNALAAVGIYRRFKKLQEDITPLIPEAKQTIAQARATLQQASAQIEEIGGRSKEVLAIANTQLQAFNETRGEVTERLRAQMDRLELVLDDGLSKVQDVVGTVHHGVMSPVREVSGVLAGIKSAFTAFLRGQRPSIDKATQDEEMFI
jgi:biopolymer transport protein ExbB/TolQ